MSKLRKLVSLCVMLALVAAFGWALYHRQYLLDQVRVWQYRPSSDVARLAERARLTETGRFYFYLSHPQLEDAAAFNQDCRRVEQASPIVGCFVSGKDQIHIYNITDPALDGIKEVTAAHEMLHVVWSRLSSDERQRLGALLETAYQKHQSPKLAERMAYYERAQPGERQNELHSILGTEFADLGPELEAHYARYFTDRTAVLRLHEGYNQTFVRNEEQAGSLSAELAALKPEINRLSEQYQRDVATFNAKVTRFNRRAESGDFSSQADFHARRQELAAERQALRRRYGQIDEKIRQYNQKADQLNALGRQIQRLQQSLDSLEGGR